MLADPRGTPISLARRAAGLLAVGFLVLGGAELGSRLDDWMFLGISPLANPDYDSDLRLSDDGFVRGRPNGRFKRWQLNEYGFNGAPNPLLPSPDCRRVIVLGASETFGAYESPGQEFVAELRRRLPDTPCFEVINGSIAGMSVRSATAYWNGWVERFRPDVALLYPNPLLSLYISDDSDGHCALPRPADKVTAPAAPNGFSSRFLDRLRDAIDKPQWLVDAQIQWTVARVVRAHAAGWVLEEVPPQCVASFRSEVEELIGAVAATGALPVVVTHAFRSEPHEKQTHLWLRRWVPRVEGEGQVRYHQAANDSLRSLAASSPVGLFDADAVLRGCDACFADPVHFSDEGAARLASALASFLVDLPRQGEHALQ